MNYKLDITNHYATMIHFDEMIGLNNFIKIPVITDELPSSYEINLENIAINLFNEEPYYNSILQQNSDSFIGKYEDPVVLLKKAKLIIKNTKCAQIVMVNKKDYFHSWRTQFLKNDLAIVCYAHSLNYPETMIYIRVIFSGSIELSFSDENMILHTVGYEVFIDEDEIKSINEKMRKKVISNQININNLKFNNKSSRLWDRDYFNKYFIQEEEFNYCCIAIKDYDGTDI
ncbi:MULTISPECIES: hypothetical protein [Gilliamella]|uniref:Uncharacterized protein n=1 Tax=Gilliamella intestini TaxID=1798183 RepID=A0A1C4DTW6_9GAMM|nr:MULTISPECIES: hypothetical protein [Gilliamella]MWP63232.1 hypothetical protein [Gilliamella sp. Pas-s25]SCC34732.1 hypothetical protein GA0061080_11071 [Gilliamella intestini]